MSATSGEILKLETAVGRPVVQHPRRGRLPKAVTGLAEYRKRRERIHLEAEQQRHEDMMKVASRILQWVADRRIKSMAICIEESDGTERAAFLGGYTADMLGAVEALSRGAEYQSSSTDATD